MFQNRDSVFRVMRQIQSFLPDFTHLTPSILLSALTSFPIPAEDNHPHSMMLSPPRFSIGIFFQCATQFSNVGQNYTKKVDSVNYMTSKVNWLHWILSRCTSVKGTKYKCIDFH
ncbi:hypothetical protein ILYODFUR_030964 [Ilyodon furcidens]|uniref:Uncharacterized protein n=1 Tax=Ilyodon furcidens TaxID=33524 RepID=A0ABV0TN75_9TELE